MNRIDESHKWAERALNTDSESDAIELWQKIFGDEKFPASLAEIKGRSLKRAMVANSLFVSPTGRLKTENPTKQDVVVRPQRFYGE